jgi:hypothetical protein
VLSFDLVGDEKGRELYTMESMMEVMMVEDFCFNDILNFCLDLTHSFNKFLLLKSLERDKSLRQPYQLHGF